MPRGRTKGGGGGGSRAGGARASNRDDEVEKLTKQEKAVADYLYHHVGSKKATMYGNHMLYFNGAKAISVLMESKFAQPNTKDTLFVTRRTAVDFCQTLLEKHVFHHVNKTVKRQKRKLPKTDDESKSKSQSRDESTSKSKSKKSGDAPDTPDLKESSLRKRKEGQKSGDGDKSKDDKSDEKKKEVKKKDDKNEDKPSSDVTKTKKKVLGKVLLDLRPDQVFIEDAKEYYVWRYEVTSVWKWFIGAGLIIGTIAVCLFPLWPESMRTVAWYATSTLAMALLGLILVLAVVRLAVYACVFAATSGKCRYWLFPNLFAEVGFFESFQPLYSSKWVKHDHLTKKKDSDREEDDDDDNDERQSEPGSAPSDNDRNSDEEADEPKDDVDKQPDGGTGSEEGSKKSLKDTSEENDFEMVNV